MKKWEQFTKEEIISIVSNSESYREVAGKLGYAQDGGSAIKTIKEMTQELDIDTSHFKGQGHTKNKDKYKFPIEDYLNNKRNISSYKLRNRLLKEGIFEYKCCCCGLTEWLNQPIPLELHHKDGNKRNNSLENLELRCPNCRYFTDTYKTKNWNN